MVQVLLQDLHASAPGGYSPAALSAGHMMLLPLQRFYFYMNSVGFQLILALPAFEHSHF